MQDFGYTGAKHWLYRCTGSSSGCVTCILPFFLHVDRNLTDACALFPFVCRADELIDLIEGNRRYIKCLYCYNKIDAITMEEVEVLARQPNRYSSVRVCPFRQISVCSGCFICQVYVLQMQHGLYDCVC